jgi:hypothetical protein
MTREDTRVCPDCGKPLEAFGPILACLDCEHIEELESAPTTDDYADYSDLEDAT